MHTYNIKQKGKPLAEADKAILLLHGRGATAEDILSLADHFDDGSFYIAAPQATNHTWYPYGFMTDEARNEPWLSSAVATVKQLIDATAEKIPLNKIYLVGFSQGACLALETAARHADRFGGIIAFTGGLIGLSINTGKYKGDFEGTPVFIGNSDHDPHVPLLRSQESKKVLEQMGAAVTLSIYPGMPHTIIAPEMTEAKKIFL